MTLPHRFVTESYSTFTIPPSTNHPSFPTTGQEVKLEFLMELRSLMSSATKSRMQMYLDENVLGVLEQCILTRQKRTPLREIDAIVIFESVLCLKTIMNNGLGMDAGEKRSGSCLASHPTHSSSYHASFLFPFIPISSVL